MRRGTIALVAAGIVAVGCIGPRDAPPDAEQFCMDRGYWECRRDPFAGRIDDAELYAMYAECDDLCL